MKKKFIFLILGFLVLAAGGFFWFSPQILELMKGPRIKGSPDDYVIRELGQARWVENKRAGFSVKVPEGWIIKKMDFDEGSMVFYSPDAEGVRPGDKIRPPLKKGCLIETAVAYKRTTFAQLRKEIESAHQWLVMKSDEFEMVNINGFQALKNSGESVELGPGVAIYIPTSTRLTGISLLMAPSEIERCSQDFAKFLQTVLIE